MFFFIVIKYLKVYEYLYIDKRHKKNVEFDSCRSTIRGLRIAHHIRTTTRSPRRNVCILYTFVRRIYASLRGMLQNIPAGHLTLLSSEYDYESCEVSNHQNKASINAYICNMSVNPPSKNRHNPLAWVYDTKVRIIF